MLNQNIRIVGGNLGRDPEIKYTQSGMAIANFSVATSHGKKKDDGTYDNITTWHNITAFGKTAERVGAMAQKGTTVLVVGESRTDTWEDQNGQKRYKDYVIANRVDFVANLVPADQQPDPTTTVAQPQPTSPQDDDLPF